MASSADARRNLQAQLSQLAEILQQEQGFSTVPERPPERPARPPPPVVAEPRSRPQSTVPTIRAESKMSTNHIESKTTTTTTTRPARVVEQKQTTMPLRQQQQRRPASRQPTLDTIPELILPQQPYVMPVFPPVGRFGADNTTTAEPPTLMQHFERLLMGSPGADRVGFGPSGFGGRDVVTPPAVFNLLQYAARQQQSAREHPLDSEMVRALRESFNMYQQHQQPIRPVKEEKKLPETVLQNKTVGPDEEVECEICYDKMTTGALYVQTTCCGTKTMHINCAIHCLRQSELCPFCHGAKVAFQ